MTDFIVEELVFHGRGPCSFRVEGGTCLAVTGPSGIGKSLLLRALADLDPHSGRVALGPIDCARIPAPQWRRRVGMLPAESGWWHDRVGEHFAAGNVRQEWLRQLGFAEDVLAWQVQRLSTGEKQRLAIVRLLANRPEALLLDEPTASLDGRNVARAEELLLTYGRKSGAPMIWVSHDPAQVERVAGQVLVMGEDGITVRPGRGG